MTRQTRRSLLAAVGTGLVGTLAGCGELNPLSRESSVEYDDAALASLPDDLPPVPAATPVQPTQAHLADARQRVRSLLADGDLSRIPNEAVRHRLAREREAARSALDRTGDRDESRVEALAGLTHPRSEAMFVDAGVAAFDGELTVEDVGARRSRHHSDAEAFVADYRYVGPPDDSVGALAEHVRIADWGHTGVRLTEQDRRNEYENTVLRVGALAQDVEWGRAYAADARRLSAHYRSTLSDPRDHGRLFARVAKELAVDVEDHVGEPDRTALREDIERDIEDTAGATLLDDLARNRWGGARDAVQHEQRGEAALAIASAMRAVTADRALAAVTDAVSAGAYDIPASVDPIARERAAAVSGLRTLLETEPRPLARHLAQDVHNPIRSADDDIRRGTVSDPGRYLYARYAAANRLADAAPAVVRRVGDALRA